MRMKGDSGWTVLGFNYNPDCKGTVLRAMLGVNDGRCIVQSDTGIETLFENNYFIQTTDKPISICEQADGKSHRYVNNVFALKTMPKAGWQNPAMKETIIQKKPSMNQN